MAPVLVTLNDFEAHSPIARLFKCKPSNTCAVFHKISTDSVLALSISDSWSSCRNGIMGRVLTKGALHSRDLVTYA